MGKTYGISTELKGYIGQGAEYEDEVDGVIIKFHDDSLELWFESLDDEARAVELAECYINANILRNGIKIETNFNHRMYRMNSGIHHSLNLRSSVKVTDNLRTKIITVHDRNQVGNARIISRETYDSSGFDNDANMAHKAMNNPGLKRALYYFSHEAIDTERPLAGIYKAIESITNELGGARTGRAKLAELAAKSDTYVRDLMQATQFTRHAQTSARKRLPEEMCIARAKILIDAYAKSLVI